MRIVILGNGFAGVTALETIRNARSGSTSAEVQVAMVSREQRGFYSPASLFAFVEGRVDEAHMILRQKEFYEQLGVETYFGQTATRIDAGVHGVELEDGRLLAYDRLLIATGSSARLWAIPGVKAQGVFKLDWMDDAYAIMEHLKRKPQPKVVVVGAGRLGVELAAVLQENGARVTLLEKMGQVLPGVFDLDIAALIEQRLTTHGVRVRLDEPLQEVTGNPVRAIRTPRGELPCDMLALAMGRRPNTDFIDTANISLGEGGGVLVDEFLRAGDGTRGQVYAAGDCAEPFDFLGRRAINGVIPTAVEMGRLAALNMLGIPMRYDGSINANVLIVFGRAYFSLGSLQGERFKHQMGDFMEIFVVQAGRLVGAQFAGETRSAAQALQAIRRGASFETMSQFDGLRKRLLIPVSVRNVNR